MTLLTVKRWNNSYAKIVLSSLIWPVFQHKSKPKFPIYTYMCTTKASALCVNTNAVCQPFFLWMLCSLPGHNRNEKFENKTKIRTKILKKKPSTEEMKKKQCESQVFFEPNRQRCVIFFLCASLFFLFLHTILVNFCAFLFIVASYSLLQFVLHHLCYLLFLYTRWKRVRKKMKKRNISVCRIDKMLHEYTFNIYLPH